MLPTTVTSPPRCHVCVCVYTVCAVYDDVFIHPHALPLLSVGLSFSVRIIEARCSAAVAGWLGWLVLKQRNKAAS